MSLKEDWIDLIGETGFVAWRGMPTGWMRTQEVTLDASNPKKLTATESAGKILVNLPQGKNSNLVTQEVFADVEAKFEFLISEKSNSGIKFIGHYEIQILDSYGKKADQLTGSDCGGVYPRGERWPRYHTIDPGTPPRTNACKAPGEWQKMEIQFRAPRFSATGRKVENARFLSVKLNDVLIQENVIVKFPTGSAWRKSVEVERGPILMQGDHGPCAFRNLQVRRATYS